MRLPWWEEGKTAENFLKSIAAAQEVVQRMTGTARMEMEAQAFVSTVMVSCEAESVPVHIISAEEILRLLTKQFCEIMHYFPPHLKLNPLDRRFFFTCDHHWPWQRYLTMGGSFHAKAACCAQMVQHLKALMFLCIYSKDEHLNLTLLRNTHAILMKGYLLPDHSSIFSNGIPFRKAPLVTDTGAAMIHNSTISNNVKDMLRRLEGEVEPPPMANTHASTSNGLWRRRPLRPHDSFEFPQRCATLLHDMTHIQPFQVGNEWMCRLLMAFFMVAHDRFVFPVPIAPITDRPSKDFLYALSTPDDDRFQLHKDPADGFRREKALLSAYILECVWESLEEIINAF